MPLVVKDINSAYIIALNDADSPILRGIELLTTNWQFFLFERYFNISSFWKEGLIFFLASRCGNIVGMFVGMFGGNIKTMLTWVHFQMCNKMARTKIRPDFDGFVHIHLSAYQTNSKQRHIRMLHQVEICKIIPYFWCPMAFCRNRKGCHIKLRWAATFWIWIVFFLYRKYLLWWRLFGTLDTEGRADEDERLLNWLRSAMANWKGHARALVIVSFKKEEGGSREWGKQNSD